MSQDFSVAATTPAGAYLPWWEAWISALARPSVETYEDLVRDPEASSGRAYIWMFITALISFVISALAQALLPGASSVTSAEASEMSALLVSSITGLICGAPVAALVSVLSLIIRAGITHWIARALGGTGTYSRLVYAFAAFLAPLSLIFTIVGSIPYVNCLVFPLVIYAVVLSVIAVKAVNQFGWGKAMVSSVLFLAAILVLVAVVVIFVLALLGPAVANVFSNIMQEVGAPAP